MPPLAIAVGGLFVECNHLGGAPTDLAAFERYELLRGREILDQESGTLGGMLHTLQDCLLPPVPLVMASACSGGPVTREAYDTLKGDLLSRLREAEPVVGVLLALHGSGAVEGLGDLEGDLLASVRAQVGPSLPIVATLDLHAHVTDAMVQSANALVAWETYPHKDAYTTGSRAARLLADTVLGRVRPAMALAKVPVLVGGVHGHTEGPGPFADIMRYAKSLEGKDGVLSTSAFLVHPYLDVADMGGGGLVITDGDPDRAVKLASDIALRYWERRFDLDPAVYSTAEAIRQGLRVAGGPVLLVETADCAGGGAAGDSVATLKALLVEAADAPALVPVVDPAAALQCHEAGVNGKVTFALGHRVDPRWGEPTEISGQVTRLSDGRFRYVGGIWDGREGHMGPSAVLRVGEVQILITTHATYDWADEQFASMGLDARRAKFVVVKNPMNYRLGYADITKAAFILDTPGPTPAVLHHVRYQNLKRPYFPLDRDIPNLIPRVCSHGQ